jgi:hypothetical protein
MPELNPDSIERRTIDPNNTAVKDWARREGWDSPSDAEFKQDPNLGVWVWHDQVRDKPTAVLPIHERLVARLLADYLVQALWARVAEIRRQVKARIWDNGLVTRY